MRGDDIGMGIAVIGVEVGEGQDVIADLFAVVVGFLGDAQRREQLFLGFDQIAGHIDLAHFEALALINF